MNDAISFEQKCSELSDFWMTQRKNPEYSDFIYEHDFTFPLAYILLNKIADANSLSVGWIDGLYKQLQELLSGEYSEWESDRWESDS